MADKAESRIVATLNNDAAVVAQNWNGRLRVGRQPDRTRCRVAEIVVVARLVINPPAAHHQGQQLLLQLWHVEKLTLTRVQPWL